MRLLSLIVAAVVLFTASAAAVRAQQASVRTLVSVELHVDSLMRHDGMRTVEVTGAKRTAFGSFYSVRLFDVVSALPGVREANRASLVVVCESSDGQTCTASFAELDPDIVKLPALLLLGPGSGTRLDSFALSDVQGSNGTVDLSQLEREFGKVTRMRYVLNDAELTSAERTQFRTSGMRLLFPYDRSAFRWLADIKYVHVLLME